MFTMFKKKKPIAQSRLTFVDLGKTDFVGEKAFMNLTLTMINGEKLNHSIELLCEAYGFDRSQPEGTELTQQLQPLEERIEECIGDLECMIGEETPLKVKDILVNMELVCTIKFESSVVPHTYTLKKGKYVTVYS